MSAPLRQLHVLEGSTIVINGGPGAGKTHWLLTHAQKLIATGHSPIVVSSSRAAARTTQDQLTTAFPQLAGMVRITTPAALARETVRRHHKGDAQFVSTWQARRNIHEILRENNVFNEKLLSRHDRLRFVDAIFAFGASWLGNAEIRTHADAAYHDDLKGQLCEEIAHVWNDWFTHQQTTHTYDQTGTLIEATLALRSSTKAAYHSNKDVLLIDDHHRNDFATHRFLLTLSAATQIASSLRGRESKTIVTGDPNGPLWRTHGQSWLRHFVAPSPFAPDNHSQDFAALRTESTAEATHQHGQKQRHPKADMGEVAHHQEPRPAQHELTEHAVAQRQAIICAHRSLEAEVVISEVLRAVHDDVALRDIVIALAPQPDAAFLRSLQRTAARYDVALQQSGQSERRLHDDSYVAALMDTLQNVFSTLSNTPGSNTPGSDTPRSDTPRSDTRRSDTPLLNTGIAHPSSISDISSTPAQFAATSAVSKLSPIPPLSPEQFTFARASTQRGVAATAFALWERVLAPQMLPGHADREMPESIDAVTLFLRTLTNIEQDYRQHRTTKHATFPFWRDVLETAGAAKMNATEHRRDGVLVLSPHEFQGHKCSVLILAGCVEGQWPRPLPVANVIDLALLDGPEAVDPAVRTEHDLGEQHRQFLDITARASRRVVAVGAPEPGVLPSRWIEGWTRIDASFAENLTNNNPAATGRETTQFARDLPITEGIVPAFPAGSLRLSASQLDTYENCPLNYAYQYVAGVRGSGSVQASVGTIVHAALETFLKPLIDEPELATSKSLEALLADLDSVWDSAAFDYRPQEADYRRRAEEWLSLWWDNEWPNIGAVIATEHRFLIDVGQHQLAGSIDRISRDQFGQLEIVDYKTGNPQGVHGEDNLQLAAYHLAALRDPAIAKHGRPDRLRLHFLVNSSDVDQPITDDHEQQTLSRIEAQAQAILSEQFDPSIDADCMYCSFQRICPTQIEGREVIRT